MSRKRDAGAGTGEGQGEEGQGDRFIVPIIEVIKLCKNKHEN